MKKLSKLDKIMHVLEGCEWVDDLNRYSRTCKICGKSETDLELANYSKYFTTVSGSGMPYTTSTTTSSGSSLTLSSLQDAYNACWSSNNYYTTTS